MPLPPAELLATNLESYSLQSPTIWRDLPMTGEDRHNISHLVLYGGEDSTNDYTLTAQIGELITRSCTDESLIPATDIVAVTLKSAVPAADMVRGIFEAANIKTPPIIGISINRQAANAYSLLETGRYKELNDTDKIIAFSALRQAKKQFEECPIDIKNKRVTVVDEFIASGATIRTAIKTITAHGAESCGAIAGRWYNDYQTNPEELSALSSLRYSDFFKSLGKQAFELWSIKNKQNTN